MFPVLRTPHQGTKQWRMLNEDFTSLQAANSKPTAIFILCQFQLHKRNVELFGAHQKLYSFDSRKWNILVLLCISFSSLEVGLSFQFSWN